MSCATKWCRNDTYGRTHCSTCRVRRFKRKSPFKYYYGRLKSRAKERGKPFNLSLEQFKLIWLSEPEKWEQKKADGECKWQMDRRDNTKGYEFDNIQILSKRKNIMKYVREDRFHMEVKWVPKITEQTVEDHAPF